MESIILDTFANDIFEVRTLRFKASFIATDKSNFEPSKNPPNISALTFVKVVPSTLIVPLAFIDEMSTINLLGLNLKNSDGLLSSYIYSTGWKESAMLEPELSNNIFWLSEPIRGSSEIFLFEIIVCFLQI